jgi:hypothetical protein
LTDKKIHIVAFDVPFPADYGGVIDIYYRIEALYKLGYKIKLHCFEYGRGEQSKLSEITENVYYYPRKKSFFDLLNSRPFIVSSRRSNEILNRLLSDDSPILFEGLHTTWFLENKEIQKKKTFVRTHNIEHEYYISLARNATFFKKYFFKQEAKKLEKYESILKYASKIGCIKEGDLVHFGKYSHAISILPASIPKIADSKFHLTEEYVLFNGNLSVSENEKAAIWIIENIWKNGEMKIPLIIAGKNPTTKLIELTAKFGIELISNPTKDKMESLLNKARIHLLVSDQSTGVKLKILSALQTSGHVLVNPTIIEGTNLASVCTICENPEMFNEKIKELVNKELDINIFNKRIQFLSENFDTVENCRKFFG